MSTVRRSLPTVRGNADGADCTSCPFATHAGRPNRPVFGGGAADPKWLIIGEGPGRMEQALGVAFIGPSGQLVSKMLQSVGVAREQVFISNATLCLPSTDATDKQKQQARKACAPRLKNELDRFPGKPVLALGAVAAQAFLGDNTSISKVAGSYHVIRGDDQIDRVVIPSTHPAAILRGGAGVAGAHAPDLAFWNLVYDGAKINAISDGRDIVFRAELNKDIFVEYEDEKRADRLIAMIAAKIRQAGYFAIDTETYVEDDKRHSALQPINAKLRAIGLATTELAVCIHWEVRTPFSRGVIASLLADQRIRKIMQNRLYDRPVLRRHSMPVYGQCDDTLLKHHNAFPGLSHNLQRMATQYFAIPPWKSEFRASKETKQDLVKYCLMLGTPIVLADGRTKTIEQIVRQSQSVAVLSYGKNGIEANRVVAWHQNRVPNQKWLRIQIDRLRKNERGLILTPDHKVFTSDGQKRADRVKVGDKLLLPERPLRQAKRPVEVKVTAVGPYKPKYKTRTQRLVAETRFCITVEGNHNFFTSFGLVSNCSIDTLATARLDAPLTLAVKKTSTERTYEVDLACADVAEWMYDVGVPLSREVNEQLYQHFKSAMDTHRAAIELRANDEKIRETLFDRLAQEQAKRLRKGDCGDDGSVLGFEERKIARLLELKKKFDKGKWRWNVGSSDHIVAYLKASGVPLYFVTPTGRTSTKKEILEGFAHQPDVRGILDYRENQKLFSTYVASLYDRVDAKGKTRYGYVGEDGRLHPRWNVHRITGRWSSEDPSCQNWPKEDKKRGRPNLRTQVVAPRGRKLVGFDFCLAAGTAVDTPNGAVPIEDIQVNDLVFSFDFDEKRPRCSKVVRRAFTGLRTTLKVVLDTGAEVRCTPEHRWYVRPWGSGTNAVELQASALRPGMRLLPLRRGVSGPTNSRYETLYSYSAFQYVKTHVVVAEAALGKRPDDHHVHHKNGNKLDNRPDNLAYKPIGEHLSEHSSVNAERQWRNPEVRAKMQLGISTSIKLRGGYHGENNPMYGHRSGEFGRCPQCGKETYYGGKKPKRFCSRACYNEFRKNNHGHPRGTVWHDLNHKIVAVIDDGLVVPTYDIEVENDHNFALSAGVFVHNSQLEARLIALLSGDSFLVDIFRQGKDIHSEFARIVWKDFDTLPPERRKKLRDEIKRPEYGAYYGGKIETLWRNVVKDYPTVKIQDIAEMVRLMTEKMTGLTRWHQKILRDAAQSPHEVRSAIYGRRRCFPLGEADINDVYNFPIQSSGSDLMATGIMRIVPKLRSEYRDAWPILQIHDAMVFECWKADAERLKADIIECFTQEHTFGSTTIHFPVDAKIGDTWAEV